MNKDNTTFPSNEMLQFLTQIAFVGIEKGYFDEAKDIFNTVEEICPSCLEAKITKAFGYIVMGHLEEGARLLFQVLKKDPKNETAKGFLMIAFKLSRQEKEAQTCALGMLEVCKDENMRTLANDIVEEYKRRITPQKLQAEQCQHLIKETYARH